MLDFDNMLGPITLIIWGLLVLATSSPLTVMAYSIIINLITGQGAAGLAILVGLGSICASFTTSLLLRGVFSCFTGIILASIATSLLIYGATVYAWVPFVLLTLVECIKIYRFRHEEL